MSSPLSKREYQNWINYKNLAEESEEKITDRIDDILVRLFELNDFHVDYWYFDGANEGEVGSVKIRHGKICDLIVYVKRARIALQPGFKSREVGSVKLKIPSSSTCLDWDGTRPIKWLFDSNF